MDNLLLVAAAGFAASMVDGALGMGFGPTSSSILLAAGLPPAATSATVNVAKVATGLSAGISHWKFGNIDRRLVVRLALPGCVGALIGTTVLSRVDGDALRPWLAVLLLVVGIRILFRFRKPLPIRENDGVSSSQEQHLPASVTKGCEIVGGIGGVTNGLIGAWGPVVTPFLLHRGVSPRTAVGSVNTAEAAVAAVSAGSLLAMLSSGTLDVRVVLAMLLGGVVAAPIAAWSVRHLPARPMGLAVGGLLLVTNARDLASRLEIGDIRWAMYATIAAAIAAAALAPKLTNAPRVRVGNKVA
jgi:uncharacterized protein